MSSPPGSVSSSRAARSMPAGPDTDGVAQAPAAPRLIQAGLPTEATIAHVLVSKYADHLALYRQAQIYARQGVDLDRSTLADWVGRAAFELRPVYDALMQDLKKSTKLFMDETRAPVLDPGARKTRTGYFRALARDDRPWGGAAPPAVAFTYAPGRGGQHAERILQGFGGILQVDGYAGYNRLLTPDHSIWLAYCWTHLWMPPLLQGISAVRHLPRLRSSIRPVVAMRPAPPALMVKSASRVPITRRELEARCAQRVWPAPVRPVMPSRSESPSHLRKPAEYPQRAISASGGHARWCSVSPSESHHCPDNPCRFVGHCDRGNIRRPARTQPGEPKPGFCSPPHD